MNPEQWRARCLTEEATQLTAAMGRLERTLGRLGWHDTEDLEEAA